MPSALFGFNLSDIYSRVIPGAVGTTTIAGPYILYGYDQTEFALPQGITENITIALPILLLLWFGFGEAVRYFRRANGGVPREFREQYQYYHPETDNSYLIEALFIKMKLSSWDTPNNAWTDQCQFFWDDIGDRFNLDTRKSGHNQVYKILQKDLENDLTVNTFRHKSLYELSRNIRMSLIISYFLLSLLLAQQFVSNSAILYYNLVWSSLTLIAVIFMSHIYRIIFVGLGSIYINDLLTEYYIKYA